LDDAEAIERGGQIRERDLEPRHVETPVPAEVPVDDETQRGDDTRPSDDAKLGAEPFEWRMDGGAGLSREAAGADDDCPGNGRDHETGGAARAGESRRQAHTADAV